MLQSQSPFSKHLNGLNKSKNKSRLTNKILKNEYIVGEINGNRTFSQTVVKKHIIEVPIKEEIYLPVNERSFRASPIKKKKATKVRIIKQVLPEIKIQKSPLISNWNKYKDIVVTEKVLFVN